MTTYVSFAARGELLTEHVATLAASWAARDGIQIVAGAPDTLVAVDRGNDRQISAEITTRLRDMRHLTIRMRDLRRLTDPDIVFEDHVPADPGVPLLDQTDAAVARWQGHVETLCGDVQAYLARHQEVAHTLASVANTGPTAEPFLIVPPSLMSPTSVRTLAFEQVDDPDVTAVAAMFDALYGRDCFIDATTGSASMT